MSFPFDITLYPSSGEEVHLRNNATCTAEATRGYFDPISGAAEPPSGPEFDLSSGLEVEWPFESEKWHPAPDWMIEELFTDAGNHTRLEDALAAALADHDLAEREKVAELRAE